MAGSAHPEGAGREIAFVAKGIRRGVAIDRVAQLKRGMSATGA